MKHPIAQDMRRLTVVASHPFHPAALAAVLGLGLAGLVRFICLLDTIEDMVYGHGEMVVMPSREPAVDTSALGASSTNKCSNVEWNHCPLSLLQESIQGCCHRRGTAKTNICH